MRKKIDESKPFIYCDSSSHTELIDTDKLEYVCEAGNSDCPSLVRNYTEEEPIDENEN